MRNLFWLTSVAFTIGCFGKSGTDDTGTQIIDEYDGVKGEEITLCAEGTGCEPDSRIVGTVTDADGVLLADVNIDLSSGDSTATGANGAFMFTGLDPDQTVIVKFSKDGYTPYFKEVTLGDWQQFDISISLAPVGATFVFDSDEGGSFSEGQVSVDISGGAFYSRTTGEPITGEVTLHITAPDVGLTIEGAPGDFVAINPDDGSENLIHSYGFFDIQAWQGDDELNLVDDDVVDMRLDITENLRDDSAAELGDTVPFWWWDPETARWEYVMELDILTDEETGQRYVEADMPHFSAWNTDDYARTTCIDVAVIDVLGNPIEGSLISMSGTSYSGSYSNYSSTDPAGEPLLGMTGGAVNITASMAVGGETYSATEAAVLSTTTATSNCPDFIEIELPICIAAGNVSVSKIQTITTDGYATPALGGFGYFFEPDGGYDFCSTGYEGKEFESCELIDADDLNRSDWGIDLVPAGDIVRVGNDAVDVDLERTGDEDVYYGLSTDDILYLAPYVEGGYVFDVTLEGEDGGYPGITDAEVVTMPEPVDLIDPDPEGEIAFDRDEDFTIEYVGQDDPMGIFVTMSAQLNADDSAVLFCRFNDDGDLTIPSSQLGDLDAGDTSVMVFRVDEEFFEMPYGYAGRANTLTSAVMTATAH